MSPPPQVGSTPTAAPSLASTPTPERGPAPGDPVAGLEPADIRPLDVSGALKILIAEVLAAFEDSAGAALLSPAAAPAAPEDPVAAARLIVERVLQSLPAKFEPQSMSAALPRADAALQSGVRNALRAVGAWPDVTPAVVDAAKDAAGLALRLIAGDPPYPSWPPPEWVALAPALRRLWRRRRALGRALKDPDYDINAQRATLDELG